MRRFPRVSRSRAHAAVGVVAALFVSSAALVFISGAPLEAATAARPQSIRNPLARTPPAVPFLESVTAVGRGVLATWNPDPMSQAVTFYSVAAKPAAGSSAPGCASPKALTVSVSASATEAFVRPLCAAVVYRVTVSARNAAGASAASPASSPVVPLIAQAPDRPLIESVTARNDALIVNWGPSPYDGGYPVETYRLRATSGTQVISLTEAASDTTATMTGLTDGDTYDVSLYAISAAGVSAAATSSGTPAPAYAPSAPLDLSSVPTGASGVKVSWRAPANDGGSAVTKYTISYQQEVESSSGRWSPAPDAPVETVTAAATASSAIIRAFPKSPAYYLFAISASNSTGTSPAVEAPAPVTPTVAIDATTVVLKPASSAALAAVTKSSLVWKDPAPAQVGAIKVGDVVTSAPAKLLPEGTLRKVTAVTNNGETLGLTTIQASLAEAASNLSVSSEQDAGPGAIPTGATQAARQAPVGHIVPTVAGVQLVRGGQKSAITSESTFDINLKLGNFQVGGEFSITTQVGIDMSVAHGFAGIPNGVSVNAFARQTYSIEADVTASYSPGGIGYFEGYPNDRSTWKVIEIDLEPILLDVGIPITVNPKLPVFLTLQGSASIGFQAIMTVGAAVGWSSSNPRHLQVTNLSHGPQLSGGPAPGLSLQASLFAYIEVACDLEIDDVAGPDVAAQFGLQATVNPSPNPGQNFFQIGPALKLQVGLAVQFFSHDTQLEFTFSRFYFPSFDIKSPPKPAYKLTPVDPSVMPGKTIVFHVTRTEGQTEPLTWSIAGGTEKDTISSNGRLTVGGPVGRTLTVKVRDPAGATGQTLVTIGAPFYPPAGLQAVTLRPFRVGLSWTAPAATGGHPISHYVVTTEPASSAKSIIGTSTTLGGLATGYVDAEVYAVNSAGAVSPGASIFFDVGPNGTLVTDAGSWSVEPVSLPSASDKIAQTTQPTIACGSTGICASWGSYDDSSGVSHVILWAEENGAWVATIPPVPSGATTPFGTDPGNVGGSCSADGICAVYAWFNTSSGSTIPASWVYSAGRWTARSVPLPAGAAFEGYFGGIACAATCLITGNLTDNQRNVQHAGSWVLSGKGWTFKSLPLPPNAYSSPPMSEVSGGALSCSDVGPCVAGGYYAATYDEIALWTFANGAWSAAEAPTPKGFSADYPGGYVSVSCGVDGTCAAAGLYVLESSPYSPKDGLWVKSRAQWEMTPLPLPSNAFVGSVPGISGPSCGSRGMCALAGMYQQTTGANGYALWTLSTGKWTVTPVNAPKKGYTPDGLLDPYCSAGTCVAAFNYGSNQNSLVELERYSNQWVSTVAPLPSADDYPFPSPIAAAVSCESAKLCFALGGYINSSNVLLPVIWTMDGTTWTASVAPLPSGATGGFQMVSLACASAGAVCAANGFYNAGSQYEEGLWVFLTN